MMKNQFLLDSRCTLKSSHATSYLLLGTLLYSFHLLTTVFSACKSRHFLLPLYSALITRLSLLATCYQLLATRYSASLISYLSFHTSYYSQLCQTVRYFPTFAVQATHHSLLVTCHSLLCFTLLIYSIQVISVTRCTRYLLFVTRHSLLCFTRFIPLQLFWLPIPHCLLATRNSLLCSTLSVPSTSSHIILSIISLIFLNCTRYMYLYYRLAVFGILVTFTKKNLFDSFFI